MKNVSILFVSIFSIHCTIIVHLLKEEIPRRLPKLKNLVILSLPENDIKELPNHICKLRQLRHILLDKNKFTSLPFLRCRMGTLSLNNNNVKIFPSDLTSFHFTNVDLKYNELTVLPENITWGDIMTLDLSHNKITNLPKEFNKNNIYILNVSFNELTTLPNRLGVAFKEKYRFGFRYYRNEQTLVDVSYNKIEKIPDAFLKNNKKIEKLILTGNPLSEAEVEKVRRALPDTEVVF